MDPNRLDRLSDRQKDCLRLVYQNYNAKQIGRKLKISPHTVNRHLQDARSSLGVSRSMDLAIALMEHEGGNRITNEPAIIPPLANPDDIGKAMAPISSGALARNRWHLERLHRIGLIVAIAFLAVAFAGALRAGLEDLTRFFWDYQIDISDQTYRQ